MVRCPACGTENPTDALFCTECAASLARVCANCGTPNTPASKFCKRCGTPLVEVMLGVPCPACGTENNAGGKFCKRCGSPMEAAAPAATTPAASDVPIPDESIPPEPPAAPALQTPALPATAVLDPATQRKTCPRCGATNDYTDRFCHRCGWTLDNARISDVSAGVPAGFWIRVLAALIDSIVLLSIGWAFGQVLGPEPTPVFRSMSDFWDFLRGEFFSWRALLEQIPGVIYYTALVGATGGTVGKLVLGMRVVRANGGRVSYWRALGRYLAYWPSGLVFGLGYLWIAFDKDKRGWHDHLSGTKVVRKL